MDFKQKHLVMQHEIYCGMQGPYSADKLICFYTSSLDHHEAGVDQLG